MLLPAVVKEDFEGEVEFMLDIEKHCNVLLEVNGEDEHSSQDTSQGL